MERMRVGGRAHCLQVKQCAGVRIGGLKLKCGGWGSEVGEGC